MNGRSFLVVVGALSLKMESFPPLMAGTLALHFAFPFHMYHSNTVVQVPGQTILNCRLLDGEEGTKKSF